MIKAGVILPEERGHEQRISLKQALQIRVDEEKAENKDKIAENRRRYREKNKDKIAENGRRYREKNKEKHREYIRNYMRNYRRARRNASRGVA